MVGCSIIEEWEEMDPEQRFFALEEVIDDLLESWGMDPVEVVNTIDDDAIAKWTQEGSNAFTIHINPASIDGSDGRLEGAREAISVAAHEVIHIAQLQSGYSYSELESELEAGILGLVAQEEMFENCVSSLDSIAGDMPSYPFECN